MACTAITACMLIIADLSFRCVGYLSLFFFQAEDGIRDYKVTGVQTCALPISGPISMGIATALFAIAAAAITMAWAWLGAPVQMPPSPLTPGEKLYCVSYTP